MTSTELRSKSLRALRDLAKKLRLRLPVRLSKAELVAELVRNGRRKTRHSAASEKADAGAASSRRGARNLHLGRLAPAARRKKKSAEKTPPAPKPPPLAHEARLSDETAHKFDLPRHPAPPASRSPHDNLGELPEAYGTGLLFLVARDPYWLYAAWDFTASQMRAMRTAARHGELKLRILAGGRVCRDITLNPAARDWYLKVDHASTEYHGELGYWDASGNFTVASRSAPTRTPPDMPSPRTEARFATIPFDLLFRRLLELVRARRRPGEEIMDALQRLQAEGVEFPFRVDPEQPWTEDQARHLAAWIAEATATRPPAGSEEAVAGWKRPTSSGEGPVRRG
ncbi:MAG: DUF4912 domain-containing protein [Verrucomicrobiae bacterium]|nr:DUF4912 domain-containing protein [Verrucomicrobiae bacterium]